MLASGSLGGEVKLWDVKTRKEMAVLKSKQGVRSVAFSPDGKILASGNTNGEVAVWDLTTQKKRSVLSPHPFDVGSVAFSPDGKTLATAPHTYKRLDAMKLWEVGAGKPLATLTGHTGPIGQIAFSPDGDGRARIDGPSACEIHDPRAMLEICKISPRRPRARGSSTRGWPTPRYGLNLRYCGGE